VQAKKEMMMTHVIESDDYRKEVEVLKQDPIILEMYDEIPAVYFSAEGFLDSYQLILLAHRTYNERGGKNAKSIGGPARAIRAIYEEKQTASA
jgi:hypothetical protein